MSYNLKNKIVVMFAVAICFSYATVNDVRAQAVEGENIASQAAVEQPVENPADNVVENADQSAAENAAPVEEDPFGLDDPMGDEADIEDPFASDAEPKAPESENTGAIPMQNGAENNIPSQSADQPNAMPEVGLDNMAPEVPGNNLGLADVTIDAAGPKSPFEKYGNTILSRVDNDLFNQMSEIEKQTTLLNLELKREEVKNRIDALKAQRERAKQEELDREAEREKKARDEELQRQKALLQEQMRLKEKEMELEKIRQAKILTEYMNETLISNQEWVETNGKLTAQIKDLQDERKALIAEIEKKLEGVAKKTAETVENAEATHLSYERKVSMLNKQIDGLKKIISEKENALQNATNSIDNPFANSDMIDEDAIDMSKEYAIMDITGKGDNIVAKIVSQDGTTFTVRTGSVLKGGEVVTKITENYITFDNHGAKSFLYTGGTVLQYEPTEMFNDAPKTPNEAAGVATSAPAIRNVRGAAKTDATNSTLKGEVSNVVKNTSGNVAKTSNVAVGGTNNSQSTSNNQKSSNKGIASFSQGMMVK